MTNPLVSVIITCYNYGDYVEEAIRSVWAQTYMNVELIVINDGSTDNSDEVIQKLKIEKNFKYILQQNCGIIATRNKGMDLASGDFVMQLDADDLLDKTYIEKCIKIARKHKVDLVYTQVQIFGRANFVSKHIEYDLEKLKHDNYIHAAALIRKKILPKSPYDVYLNDKGNEDWDLFLGLCLDGAKAKLVNEPLLCYRKHIIPRSRSDSFSGLYKEMLVRHHIWNKYNNRYPEHFNYFSSEIDNLLQMVKLFNDFENLKEKYASSILQHENNIIVLKSRIERLEFRDPITVLKKSYRRIINLFS